jgi:hypothetical protein
MLLNRGRGSAVVAKEHAEFLLGLGHGVYFLHPNIGDGVNGAINKDVYLVQEVFPVHE